MSDDFKSKVAFIVETDGLLKDYLESVVIKKIKSRMTDDTFKDLNTNHVCPCRFDFERHCSLLA